MDLARSVEGDLSGASAAFEEGLDLARSLARDDPDDPGRARGIAVSLKSVGMVKAAQDDLAAAIRALTESLSISRDLARRDPNSAEWARDVWLTAATLALTDPANAAPLWAEVVARMEETVAHGTLKPADQLWLVTAQAHLAAARQSAR